MGQNPICNKILLIIFWICPFYMTLCSSWVDEVAENAEKRPAIAIPCLPPSLSRSVGNIRRSTLTQYPGMFRNRRGKYMEPEPLKASARFRKCCKQVKAEVVSNSRNKVLQTTASIISRPSTLMKGTGWPSWSVSKNLQLNCIWDVPPSRLGSRWQQEWPTTCQNCWWLELS